MDDINKFFDEMEEKFGKIVHINPSGLLVESNSVVIGYVSPNVRNEGSIRTFDPPVSAIPSVSITIAYDGRVYNTEDRSLEGRLSLWGNFVDKNGRNHGGREFTQDVDGYINYVGSDPSQPYTLLERAAKFSRLHFPPMLIGYRRVKQLILNTRKSTERDSFPLSD